MFLTFTSTFTLRCVALGGASFPSSLPDLLTCAPQAAGVLYLEAADAGYEVAQNNAAFLLDRYLSAAPTRDLVGSGNLPKPTAALATTTSSTAHTNRIALGLVATSLYV